MLTGRQKIGMHNGFQTGSAHKSIPVTSGGIDY